MSTKFITTAAAVAAAGIVGFAGAASARDQIRIVGSSTVYPFTTAVAEQFGKTGGVKTPVVESTGTGGGMKLFCAGVGDDHPDVTNASRRIKKSEFEDCARRTASRTSSRSRSASTASRSPSPRPARHFKLTLAQVFQALAKEVPDKDGKLVANPYKNWSDIDPSLPDEKIEVLGPPPTSGTRDAFLELVMEKGAEKFPALAALKKSDAQGVRQGLEVDPRGRRLRRSRRERQPDRPEARGQPERLRHLRLLVPRRERRASSRASPIDGVEPTFEDIAAGKYPGARPLFFYVKKEHVGVIPGIDKFVAEYVSDEGHRRRRLSRREGPRRRCRRPRPTKVRKARQGAEADRRRPERTKRSPPAPSPAARGSRRRPTRLDTARDCAGLHRRSRGSPAMTAHLSSSSSRCWSSPAFFIGRVARAALRRRRGELRSIRCRPITACSSPRRSSLPMLLIFIDRRAARERISRHRALLAASRRTSQRSAAAQRRRCATSSTSLAGQPIGEPSDRRCATPPRAIADVGDMGHWALLALGLAARRSLASSRRCRASAPTFRARNVVRAVRQGRADRVLASSRS